jgi:hypothetical protein
MSPEAGERIAADTPGAPFEGAGHANPMGFLEQAEAYSTRIRAFVASLRPGASLREI